MKNIKFYLRRFAPIAVAVIAVVSFSASLSGMADAQSVGTSTGSSTANMASSSSLSGVITVTPSILPDGTVGASYQQVLNISTTATGPFSWTVSGGTLPPGLSFATSSTANGMSAMILGTPTTPGQQFTFSVSATNLSVAATQTYVININPGNVVATTTPVSPAAAPASSVSSSTGMAASSTADLLAELNTLESKLLQLQTLSQGFATTSGSSGAVNPSAPVSCGAATFCRDLTVGDNGPDVMALQQFLNNNGFPIASTGPGSSGNETQYFGAMTQTALAGWQSANAISPAMGYFGPKTSAAVEAQMTSGNGSSSSSGSSAAPSGALSAPAAPVIPAPAPAAPAAPAPSY